MTATDFHFDLINHEPIGWKDWWDEWETLKNAMKQNGLTETDFPFVVDARHDTVSNLKNGTTTYGEKEKKVTLHSRTARYITDGLRKSARNDPDAGWCIGRISVSKETAEAWDGAIKKRNELANRLDEIVRAERTARGQRAIAGLVSDAPNREDLGPAAATSSSAAPQRHDESRSYGRSGAPELVVMELAFSPKVAGQNRIEPDQTGNYHIGLDLRLFFRHAETEFFDRATGTEYKADCCIVSGRLELERGAAATPENSIFGFSEPKVAGGLSLDYMPAPVSGSPSWFISHADRSRRRETLPNTIIHDLCEMFGPVDGTAVLRLILKKASIEVDLVDENDLDGGEAYDIKREIKQKILADAMHQLATEGQAISGEIAKCRVRLPDEN